MAVHWAYNSLVFSTNTLQSHMITSDAKPGKLES